MGGNESKMIPGMNLNPYALPGDNNHNSPERRQSHGMMSKFINLGFGSNSSSGEIKETKTVDKATTGEGT
jgi:hypothetical protein